MTQAHWKKMEAELFEDFKKVRESMFVQAEQQGLGPRGFANIVIPWLLHKIKERVVSEC